MRAALLAGSSALALMIGGLAGAEATTFNYTGAIQTYLVPHTGDYRFVIDGGAGGLGGLGASIGGEINLHGGTLLDIVAAGMGQPSYGSGGGGGSFVFVASTSTL